MKNVKKSVDIYFIIWYNTSVLEREDRIKRREVHTMTNKTETIRTAVKTYIDYTLNKPNGDKGKAGKVLEVMTRQHLMKNGISSLADVKARPNNKVDIRKGNSIRIEVKSGSGAVAYAPTDGMGGYVDPFTKEDRTAENVLAGAKLVVWYPWANVAVASGNPFKFGFVFTREQFINCLEFIGKKGLASSLKVSKNGGQLNIQTITDRMEDRLYTFLEDVPTVEEFFG